MSNFESDVSVRERLARIEARLDGLNDRFDEAILSQLKDHGKRIAAIEAKEQQRLGSRMATAGIVSAIWAAIGTVVAILSKIF